MLHLDELHLLHGVDLIAAYQLVNTNINNVMRLGWLAALLALLLRAAVRNEGLWGGSCRKNTKV